MINFQTSWKLFTAELKKNINWSREQVNIND